MHPEKILYIQTIKRIKQHAWQNEDHELNIWLLNATAMDRPAKLRRLHEFRHKVPFVSKSALEGVLKTVQDEGLPELISTKNMREANSALFDQCSQSGPLLFKQPLTTIEGNQQSILFTNLPSWIQGAYSMGGGFHHLLCKTMEKHSKLHLLVYADEITPGNVLAPVTSRKTWAIYVSFKEFHSHLQSTQAWITISVVRSSIVNSLDGNLSQMLKVLLHHWFTTHMIHLVGIQLFEPPGQPQCIPHKRLFVSLGFFIMDGSAHKFALSIKGDSGSRFCCLCKNIFLAKAKPPSEDPEDVPVATVSCFTKASHLDLASDEEIWSSWSRMVARKDTETAKSFKMWEQATGISFSLHAILADPSLQEHFQPTHVLFHDWMHALLCNGCMSHCIFHVLSTLNCWDNLSGWMSCWKVPTVWKHFQVVSLFQAKRLEKHKKANKLSSTASELLTALPLVNHYLTTLAEDSTEIQCFQSLNHLVELMQATWHQQVTPEEIQICVESILAKWKACGWHMFKKHHWLLHIASNFAKHSILPNCFCMERKNKCVGQKATMVRNTQIFEKSVLEDMVASDLTMASKPDAFDDTITLLNPKPAPKKLFALGKAIWQDLGEACHGLKIAHHARLKSGSTCSRGDVVLAASATGFDAGEVACFLSKDNQDVCILHIFSLKEKLPKHCVWEEMQSQEGVPLSAILAPVFHCKSKRGVTTLTPWQWQ